MLKEFREFALKGSVLDLAVGVIIGGAFGKIVSSLVSDVIMPILGLIIGRINLTALAFNIGLKPDGTYELSIRCGAFLQNIIDFLLISISIFLMVKLLNSFRKKKEKEEKKEEPKLSGEEILLTEIRDLLKNDMDEK
jgi:large conductance mechanosensitive channel